MIPMAYVSTRSDFQSVPQVHFMKDSLPRLGLGTWENTDPEQCAESVKTALELGYRHIDTAQGYNNEAAVGKGIEEASIDRDDIFLATKVGTRNLGYEDVIESTHASMERLNVDRLDLLYIHWPIRTYEPSETLRAFDDLVDSGTIDHVGVSNFLPEQLETAKQHLDAPIFAHQVEMNPLWRQETLQEKAREDDHWLVAYSPLARATVLDHPVVTDIAESEGSTPAQVSIAWLLSKDHVAAIPKATGESHIRENFQAQSIELSQESIDRLDSIENQQRQIDFDAAPWNQET